MSTNLANAPLVYTLWAMRYTHVPRPERFVDEIQERLRARYPHLDDVQVQVHKLTMGSDGVRVEQRSSRLWQFATADREWAFTFSDDTFALHTSSYRDHENCADRFREGVTALATTPGLDIGHVEGLGVRYVDLVAPRDGENLHEYLEEWVLPPEVPPGKHDGVRIRDGHYAASYETALGQLRLKALRNPALTLPPELNTPLIAKNGWMPERPQGEFAIVDQDHGSSFAPPRLMDVNWACDHLVHLRTVVKSLFLAMGKKHAWDVWRGEETC
ncbi:TIGR04255 family protein [Marinimicrococcus flavescens]|uniref:TIGR04255 family protein n=1 Tax=Marinimicrococcus flavescens TaxID=3031815 RepID=A0AAP3XPX0_9PROT|nr:TIGR04255 family protein [Marinimicrococcus flavescens]